MRTSIAVILGSCEIKLKPYLTAYKHLRTTFGKRMIELPTSQNVPYEFLSDPSYTPTIAIHAGCLKFHSLCAMSKDSTFIEIDGRYYKADNQQPTNQPTQVLPFKIAPDYFHKHLTLAIQEAIPDLNQE